MNSYAYQSGNVLFLILIAVALFAALSYAITSSTRGGGNNISSEKAKSQASAILSFASTLQSAMTRMRISNGCGDNEYDFSNNIYKSVANAALNTSNSNAPSSGACDLFSPSGGGVIPYVIPPEYTSSDTSTGWKKGHGAARVRQVKLMGTDASAGTVSANDIMFTLSFLHKDVCLKINETLGITNPSGDAPESIESGTTSQYTNGSLSGNAMISFAAGDGTPQLCFKTSSGEYIFMQVLLAR